MRCDVRGDGWRVPLLGAALTFLAVVASAWASDAPPAGPGPARPRSGSAPVGGGPSPDDRTDVALHTGVPLPEGRNVLWCATGQLAWDALADAVAQDLPDAVRGTLPLGAPADPALVAAMNRRSFPHDAVDSGSIVAVGGLGSDGVERRIAEALRARFGDGVPIPDLRIESESAVGYAALRRNLPFERAFRLHEKPMAFRGSVAQVRAFGVTQGDPGADGAEVARQVVLHQRSDTDSDAEDGYRGVLELVPAGSEDRIVLSALRPGPTLEATWQAAAAWMAAAKPLPLWAPSPLTLRIPRIAVDTTRRFDGILGAPILGLPNCRVADAGQTIAFSLTERGAAVASEARFRSGIGLSVPTRIDFDRPFLLALVRRGASRPYLLLWIGNADLLGKAGLPRLEAAALTPFWGAWVLDVKRTAEDRAAGFDAFLGTLPIPDGPEALARRSAAVAEWTRNLSEGIVTFQVNDDGAATLRSTLAPKPDVSTGALYQDEDSIVFVPSTPGDGSQESAIGARRRCVVRDGRLMLTLPRTNVVWWCFQRP